MSLGDPGGLPEDEADMLRFRSDRDLFGEDLKTSISSVTDGLFLQLKILDLGEKHFTAESEEGTRKTITAQVADVNKGLLSVRKIVAAGNRVVFDTDSYIEDKQTGERMWLTDVQGMYMLKMWMKNSPFKRPGRRVIGRNRL